MGNRFTCSVITVAIALAFDVSSRADEAADALLKQVEVATRAEMSLTADVTMVSSPLPGNTILNFGKPGVSQQQHWTGKVAFKRPNLARIETTQTETGKKTTEISDGKTNWTWDTASDTCEKSTADRSGENISGSTWPLFFNPNFAAIVEEEDGKTRYRGTETLDGVEYRVVEMIGLTEESLVYIGEDNFVHRTRSDSKIAGGNRRIETSLSNMVVNATLSDEVFRAAPPTDKKVVEVESPLESLLVLGSAAPDFELPSATGEKTSLEAIRKGQRFTIVNFWSFYCGNCLVELPHLQKLYDNLADQRVGVVAIHVWRATPENREIERRLNSAKSRDGSEAYTLSRIADLSSDKKLSFTMLADFSGKVMESYKVNGFPTLYILDGNGKVAYRTAGVSMRKLRAELKKLGVE